MITIDGSYGEGGGQMLRSALALSMVTGQAFTMHSIRANRGKKGLLRQHLTAVKAARQICDAQVTGAELNSQDLVFTPNSIKHGNYRFDIGTAGSTTLVLQAILPALLMADGSSTVTITGGTHNQSAPPADFLTLTFLPLLAKMGMKASLTLRRHGFYPAGGGELVVDIEPCQKLIPLHLQARGNIRNAYARSLICSLPTHIAERELHTVKEKMEWTDEQTELRSIRAMGQGNVLLLIVEDEYVTNVFSGFAKHGVSAEEVAVVTCKRAQTFLNSQASIDEYLADQLLLPMALTGSGSFSTTHISPHCESNMAVIKQFLVVDFDVKTTENHSVSVEITKNNDKRLSTH